MLRLQRLPHDVRYQVREDLEAEVELRRYLGMNIKSQAGGHDEECHDCPKKLSHTKDLLSLPALESREHQASDVFLHPGWPGM